MPVSPNFAPCHAFSGVAGLMVLPGFPMKPFRTTRFSLLLLAGLTVSLLVSASSWAAPPDAGILLDSVKPAPGLPGRGADVLPEESARPAMALDATVRVAVKSIRITGAKTLGAAELQDLVADAVGMELTLAELDELAQRITRHYRRAGYLLARAYLPAQDIVDGVIEIAVLEGRLGHLRIENQSALADDRVAARLAGLKEGEAIAGGVLEQRLLLLNDLPGVEVKSTLRPGASVGTSDLDIRVAARSPYAGSLELDNYGNRYTGDLRLGASLSAGNLAGLADSLVLRALASSGMSYGRLAWQLPVGDAGTQVGVAYSDMRYRLGEDFAPLDAHGTATIGSLYLLHPFLRSRAANINGQISHDRKHLDDRVDATATVSTKTLDLWTLGLSGDQVDGLGGGGLNTWSLAYTAGSLDMDAANKAIDDAGHRSAGSYGKLAYSFSRLQNLPAGVVLFASLQAQRAGKNLDSAEKMSLGGAQAVRAYPQGEAPADDAWLATVELRYNLAPNWQASLFHDAARGRLNHRPLAADSHNVRRLSGSGLGLAYSLPGDLSLQLGVAWRNTAQPNSDIDRTPRAWLQAIKRF